VDEHFEPLEEGAEDGGAHGIIVAQIGRPSSERAREPG
jgi:hypothetical protein